MVENIFDGIPNAASKEIVSTLLIPAGARHRVAWTDAEQPTVWLAAHIGRKTAG